ncbi:MAG TPA: lytic transglycosylase domain-containing protein [Pyrinomonadaceae bacterium]|jgi:soluble lytic murein transglycosylase-like protein
MKQIPLLVATACALLACAAGARAQESARGVFDNFAFDNGVRVAPTPAPPAHKLRLTALHVAELKRLGRLAPTAVAPTLGMTASQSLDGFTTGNQRVDALIVEAGARNGVDPVLLYAIMHRESSFKAGAVSPKGARGLMQLMPGTAARFGVRNIFDPAQNIEGGARYVRWLLERFGGDVRLALAGYNAGEGAVDKYQGVPPYRETQEYVRLIGARYALMRNPQTARAAQTVTSLQARALEAAQPAAAVYERSVYAVRLPDGKFMLMSQ